VPKHGRSCDIKMWYMAEQIITGDDWKDENRRFGLLQVPSSVSLNFEASEAATKPLKPLKLKKLMSTN
jgi:hypothetical protein